jgi:hypothetical protein
MNSAILWIVVVAIIFVLFRASKRGHAIRNPKLAFLDLTFGASDRLVEEDRSTLRDLFPELTVSKDAVPQCDVLFLYATLEQGGALRGTHRFLRATIRDSGAKVVVVASENPSPPHGGGRPTYGRANLVITLARRGDAFGRFFEELFASMMKGKPMPLAWVQLAPQVPDKQAAELHKDVPGTIFLCELGGITFA